MIPWHAIDTVFLDAGNTLVSIDFDRVAAELAELGHACEAGALRRAEAAARPAVSRFVGERRSTETEDTFHFYVRALLRGVPALARLDDPALAATAGELAARLRSPGHSHRLWCWVLPGVREALSELRELGLELLVVSNSDGTIERGLSELGLRPYFSAVVDSAIVGFEKPDPRIFEHALGRAETAASRAIHVGDLYHADVTGARAAGVHAVLLDPFSDWEGVDCERVEDLGHLARHFRAARAHPRGEATRG
jgi:HAD superfamily hydrolase (TIGR01509 family)